MYNHLTRYSFRIPRLLGVKDYLNNYFPLYTRLTRFRIRLEIYPPVT